MNNVQSINTKPNTARILDDVFAEITRRVPAVIVHRTDNIGSMCVEVRNRHRFHVSVKPETKSYEVRDRSVDVFHWNGRWRFELSEHGIIGKIIKTLRPSSDKIAAGIEALVDKMLSDVEQQRSHLRLVK
jgi:hypothetical protein